jgi:hypothetical protein
MQKQVGTDVEEAVRTEVTNQKKFIEVISLFKVEIN